MLLSVNVIPAAELTVALEIVTWFVPAAIVQPVRPVPLANVALAALKPVGAVQVPPYNGESEPEQKSMTMFLIDEMVSVKPTRYYAVPVVDVLIWILRLVT
jgi:hypothetical protein